jgi:phage tail-like protein
MATYGPLQTSEETQAEIGFLFHVGIGLNPFGVYRSVSGIGRRVDAEELREGGRNHSPHMRVGPAKYQECKIEWGLTNSTALYDWIHAVEAGYAYKRQVTVVQFNRQYVPLRIYMLWDAWPTSWEGARLNANDNAVDTEEITLAYEAVTLIPIPTSVSWTLPIPGEVGFTESVSLADGEEQVHEAVEDPRKVNNLDAPDHHSDSLVAEEPTEAEEEEADSGPTVPVHASTLAEEASIIEETDKPPEASAELHEGRTAEAGDVSTREADLAPDYGTEARERAEFPVIVFSSGSFYTHESPNISLSSGTFLEPTTWEPLQLGGD